MAGGHLRGDTPSLVRFRNAADMAGHAAGSPQSRMTDAVEKGLVIFGEQ